jgi:hypothetical protein
MIPVQLILLTIIAIGYGSKKLGLLKKEDAQPLSVLLIDIMLPALIITSFSQVEITKSLGLMSLSACIILSILFLLGWILSRHKNKKTAKTFTLLMGTYWGATLAFPFILGVYGEAGFQIFVFYDIVQAVVVSTFVPLLVEGKKNIGESLSRLARNPLFLSLIIALVMNLFNFSSDFTDRLFDLISQGITFVGLMIVGLNLEFQVDRWKSPLFIIGTKIIIGFTLALSLAALFGFTGLQRTILILAATLPPSLMAMIFSQKYHLDTKLAANTLTLALPISIGVMTVVSIAF